MGHRFPAFLLAMLLGISAACAVNPDEVLDDPGLESRARSLSAELRCLVCQNQSIDDSDAPLARDLRILVRERLVAGDSDGEIRTYLVDRYGEFVLLKPPFSSSTLLLWLTPLIVILAGVSVLLARRQSIPARAPDLTEEEERELQAVLNRQPATKDSSRTDPS